MTALRVTEMGRHQVLIGIDLLEESRHRGMPRFDMWSGMIRTVVGAKAQAVFLRKLQFTEQ